MKPTLPTSVIEALRLVAWDFLVEPVFIVVCGDRNWIHDEPIRERLTTMRERVGQALVIVHGDNGNLKARTGGRGQKGADRIAGRIAEEMGIPVVRMPAHWEHHIHLGPPECDGDPCEKPWCLPGCKEVVGDAAGPIRNRKMLDLKPKGVVAFHNNIDRSRGTKDTVTEAERRHIRTDVVLDRKPVRA